MIGIRKRTTCRLCDSTRLELGCPIRPAPVAEKYGRTRAEALQVPLVGLDLYRCADCGHVQLTDVVDPRLLFDEHYTYRSGQTRGIVEHFAAYAARAWRQWGLAPGDLVVEIGSNDGTLLRNFQQRGARVVGVDPAGTIAAEARAAGVETITGFFTPAVAAQIRSVHGPARLVAANNVFAHSDDLQGMAAGFAALLAADGVFMCEVSYLRDVLEKCLLGTIFHEHFSYHAVAPLARFLGRHGMELIDVERVGIQDGSVIVSAQRSGGGRRPRPSVGLTLAAEEESRLNTPEKLATFRGMVDALASSAADLADRIRAEGKILAGFGAARAGATLLAQMGIAADVAFIADDHPAKVGRFAGGFGIEVVPTAEIASRRPDYLLILAWIHARRIMESQRGFAAGGGRWITCVPTLEVVTPAGLDGGSPAGMPGW